MEFFSEGKSVYCIRNNDNKSQPNKRESVVSFDEGLTVPPPHVKAQLMPEEIYELEQWLSERNDLKERLEKNSLGQTFLEIIPGFFSRAKAEGEKLREIDRNLYLAIRKSLNEFLEVIESLEQTKKSVNLQQENLQKPEVTKEQIKEISEHL